MRKSVSIKIKLAVALLAIWLPSFAQEGAYSEYSPYSIYSLGELYSQGGAYNRGMAGIGIATRNRRFTNYMNPAAITARDSLSFMADFSLLEGNKMLKQGNLTSGNNSFNITSLSISFPVYRSSAVMIGVTPFSATGYGYYSNVDDFRITGLTGPVTISSYGEGALNQLFLSAGVTFWKKLSLGVEGIYYFGQYDKKGQILFSDSSFNGVNNGFDIKLSAVGLKFGVQYEQPLGSNYYLAAGATYRTSSNLKGYVSEYELLTGSVVSDTTKFIVDTLSLRSEKIKIAGELGLGISLRYGEKWRAEVNYSRSDWTVCGMSGASGFDVRSNVSFTPSVAQSLRAGFEITPNLNDVRYYLRRCTYRGGLYYETDYFKVDSKSVYKCGLTLGATLPVFRLYNGFSIGVELGQRGVAGASGNMVKETYLNFSFGVNLHDIWFQKYRYN